LHGLIRLAFARCSAAATFAFDRRLRQLRLGSGMNRMLADAASWRVVRAHFA
jgi:hypothetical protein